MKNNNNQGNINFFLLYINILYANAAVAATATVMQVNESSMSHDYLST